MRRPRRPWTRRYQHHTRLPSDSFRSIRRRYPLSLANAKWRSIYCTSSDRRCADAALRLQHGVETRGVTSYRVRDRMQLKIQGEFEGRSPSRRDYRYGDSNAGPVAEKRSRTHRWCPVASVLLGNSRGCFTGLRSKLPFSCAKFQDSFKSSNRPVSATSLVLPEAAGRVWQSAEPERPPCQTRR
jgi:hypothetical protein